MGLPSGASPTDSGGSPPSGSAEIKLGKNRTEAEVKRYTEEKERLEKKKEEIRGHLAQLRREKRELKETLLKCTGRYHLLSREMAPGGARAFQGRKSRSVHMACSPLNLWDRWVLPAKSSPSSLSERSLSYIRM